ncbi:MAG TPA: SAM-dependent methyltransferase [Pseudonocardiaceae bacterium]|jgi:methyltransferase (TIGR00027 family)|nr:SAM-dependent methyltransferase [Pseudonocardiaceae bacterium]
MEIVPPTGIGATSISIAHLRAKESARTDRLFDDPYAARFVEAGGGAGWIDGPDRGAHLFDLMAEQVALRTRFFDDALLAAATPQVVLLACGMDTRALRLPWPAGTRVVELDLPDTLAFKDAVLRTPRTTVAADLRDDWPTALAIAGWRSDLPTAWLAEGLLYALPAAAADLLLDRITANSAPDSMIAFDQVERSDELVAALTALDPRLADLWQGGPPGDPGTWLARHGWRPDVHDVAELADRFHRPRPALFRTTHGWLVTARR